MNGSVGHRCCSDLALPPIATGAALKQKKIAKEFPGGLEIKDLELSLLDSGSGSLPGLGTSPCYGHSQNKQTKKL